MCGNPSTVHCLYTCKKPQQCHRGETFGYRLGTSEGLEPMILWFGNRGA
jgi:hypothetical protein